MPKPITLTEQEKEYVLTALDEAYKSYSRREGQSDLPDLKAVFSNAKKQVETIRHRIAKEA